MKLKGRAAVAGARTPLPGVTQIAPDRVVVGRLTIGSAAARPRPGSPSPRPGSERRARGSGTSRFDGSIGLIVGSDASRLSSTDTRTCNLSLDRVRIRSGT